ncbi:MAG: hypothetical protein GX600_07345 [Dehalococcoidia bacterium]|nr:hypothetical protein [Dehalococcoidia bacterium]
MLRSRAIRRAVSEPPQVGDFSIITPVSTVANVRPDGGHVGPKYALDDEATRMEAFTLSLAPRICDT